MLLIAFLQVSLAANAQKISLSKKNAPLTEIFKELRKQSGYDFVINKDQIKIAKPVTILVNSDDLINVLNKCFEGQPFTYSMEDKMIIVVSKKSEPIIINNSSINIDVSGTILDEKGEPIFGASVKVKGTTNFTTTNKNGAFVLKNVPEDSILEVTSLGYKIKEMKAAKQLITITLEVFVEDLDEVNVISTGYQTAKVNEINGTVSLINEKSLNARSGTNILDRIIGQSSGLLLQTGKNNGNPQNTTNITIRGLGTIDGPLDPLIVLDGFVYEGDINNINPNDIEGVSILKDAAAASIWGSRAGNGVIVLTTKKGKPNQAIQVSFNPTVIIQAMPKLNAIGQMESSDYITVEKQLFDAGYFNDRITTTPWAALTPAVEIFLAQRNGKITTADAAAQIQGLQKNNTQQSYLDNFYTHAITQQYNLSLRGGEKRNAYLFSGSYDHVKGETYSNRDKINVHFSNDFKLLKNLDLITNIYFTNTESKTGRPTYNSLTIGGRYPTYLDFSSQGSLATMYRSDYTDTLAKGRLLDWKYYPAEDYKHDYFKESSQEIFANISLKYQILEGLNIIVSYQNQRQRFNQDHVSDGSSFAARDLINTFTQYNTVSGVLTRPVPIGGILSSNESNVGSQTGRTQLNYNGIFGAHSITAIAGTELRSSSTSGNATRQLGYQDDPLYSSLVDPIGYYPEYLTGNTSQIGGANTLTKTEYRFISVYGNVAYSYKGRYILSGSIRRDGSNIFGANTNDKWKPLWSTGLGWKISQESFYNLNWLPVLRLTGTFGYSGNVDLTRTASPIGGYASNTITGFPITRINAINNPDLKWEQLSQLSLRLDFELKRQILNGSFSWYIKNGTDLYGAARFDYTAWGGRDVIVRNVADMIGKGIDLDLHSKNFNGPNFSWGTDLYFSYNLSKTKKYYRNAAPSIIALLSGNNVISPLEGFPLYSLAAYKWGGLDANGNPQGYLNGQLSTNYSAMITEATNSGNNMTYMGSSSPLYFGSFINTFVFKGVSLSINMNFKLGYKVRKPSIIYSNLIAYGMGNSEFSQRWQKTGDENFTNVPSFTYPVSTLRDAFYSASEINIISGNHLRLDYVRLGYTLNTAQWKFPFRNFEVFSGVQNVGVLWRANKYGYDPDYAGVIPPTRQVNFGIRGTF
ncbi:SusC/RagA family TonB-linked outer membrane protein [Pedobacter sp. Du54]|uniref:SusC/RagA family TonB-linked outer membrane protein n=1 Tax=Pedobacter anseongensis TaxID=3133439 RepID=UPI0030A568E4